MGNRKADQVIVSNGRFVVLRDRSYPSLPSDGGVDTVTNREALEKAKRGLASPEYKVIGIGTIPKKSWG